MQNIYNGNWGSQEQIDNRNQNEYGGHTRHLGGICSTILPSYGRTTQVADDKKITNYYDDRRKYAVEKSNNHSYEVIHIFIIFRDCTYLGVGNGFWNKEWDEIKHE